MIIGNNHIGQKVKVIVDFNSFKFGAKIISQSDFRILGRGNVNNPTSWYDQQGEGIYKIWAVFLIFCLLHNIVSHLFAFEWKVIYLSTDLWN